MKLPAYPRYKPSGVEWLGEVPEHWEVKRLDYLATVKARLGWKGLTADEYVPEGFIFLATPNIKGEGEIDFTNVNYITAERYHESPEIMIQVGDVLMAKDGSTLGTTNVVRHLLAPATVNSSVAVLRPKSPLQSLYFFRWLTSALLQSVVNSMKDGQGVPNLFQADIKKFPLLLPPTAEQQSIAAFLDRETGRIDRLVAKKRELIERLKEKRTALISAVVTGKAGRVKSEERRVKGADGTVTTVTRYTLDPSTVPMKPSGIEWLGDIPEHWEAKKIKYAAGVESGHTPSRTNEELWVDCTIPWVSLNDSKALRTSDYISETKFQISELGLLNSSARLLPTHAVLFSRDATVGLCAITTRPMAVSQHFIAYLCRPGLFPEYLLLCLKAMAQELESLSLGTTISTIGMDDIYMLGCPLPPLPEQTAIVGYLDQETAKLDALVAKVEEAIERLQEYRTALITAAVTGKIDVRKPGQSA